MSAPTGSGPTTAPRVPRRVLGGAPRSRLLGVALLVALVVAAGAITVWVRAAVYAFRDMHPPRVAVDGANPGRLGLRDVEFQASDGVTLRGWYGEPAEPVVVLLVHGHRASREQLLGQANLLRRRGAGVLLFDLRAHGESGGDLATSGDLERRDVEAAMAFIRRQPETQGAAIGAIGFSVGAIALAEVAARDKGIAAVVLEAVFPTLEDTIDSDYPSRRPLERYVGVLVHRLGGVHVDEVRPADRLCAIAPRPLLLVFGAADPGLPPALRKRMLDAACDPKELWVVPGAGHGHFLEAQPEEFERRVVPFLLSALRRERKGPAADDRSR